MTGAIVVLVTLGASGALTPCRIRVSSGSFGALALVGAGFVQAAGFGTARVGSTFVHILTTCQRVASSSGLTETLRRVGRGTLSIQTTTELVTRTSASVSVTYIGEKGW